VAESRLGQSLAFSTAPPSLSSMPTTTAPPMTTATTADFQAPDVFVTRTPQWYPCPTGRHCRRWRPFEQVIPTVIMQEKLQAPDEWSIFRFGAFGECRMCALGDPTVDDMPTLVPIGALANPTVDDMPSLEVDVRFQPRAWYDAQAFGDFVHQRNGPVPIQRIYISQSRQRAYEETILQLSRYEKTIMEQSRDRVENNHFVHRTAAMTADARAAGQESVFICDNLWGQTTDEFRDILERRAGAKVHLPPEGTTDLVQVVDACPLIDTTRLAAPLLNAASRLY